MGAMQQFLALDVETANADCASICQVGLVEFDGTGPVSSWQSLVNPEEPFDGMNVSIHGISEADVADAPRFPDLYERLRAAMTDQTIVSHTPFDQVAFCRVCEKYQLPPIDCRWLDSARVTRRTWPEFRRAGYGLAPVAERLGIAFDHHVAKEDARAAGLIVLSAMTESGLTLDEWLVRAKRPISAPAYGTLPEANPDGPLFGEVVVFTGTLSVTRAEAQGIAASLGCEVGGGVTKHTTILVVGDQDEQKLAGYAKSAKHRKAEACIAAGQRILIVGEQDFRALADLDASERADAERQPLPVAKKHRPVRSKHPSMDLIVDIKADMVVDDGVPKLKVWVQMRDPESEEK